MAVGGLVLAHQGQRKFERLLPARRYASAGNIYGHVSVSVYLSVCLSQVGVLSKRVDGSSWFWRGGFFDQSYAVFLKNSCIYKNKGTFLWLFSVLGA